MNFQYVNSSKNFKDTNIVWVDCDDAEELVSNDVSELCVVAPCAFVGRVGED